MTKYFLSLILSTLLFPCLAQEAKKDEKILYVIDSIPIIRDPDKSAGMLKNEDIDHLDVVTNQEKIKASGYLIVDKIIFITTKEFLKRPIEVRKIPSIAQMERKDGRWYLLNTNTPYSGKFRNYFINGKIQGEGELKDGVAEGLRIAYYQNGNREFIRTYVGGIANGYSEEYFINGKLKQKGSFKDGKDDGVWIEYYSTGAIKRKANFVNLLPEISNDEKKFYDLQDKAIELMRAEDYKGAIKKLDEAEKLNSNYSDIYFFRGTAKLNNFDFDNALIDFDKAIQLEPMYMEALANRAFTRLRKYEFKGSRTLKNDAEVTILATQNKVDIPVAEKNQICSDLNRSVELGDTNDMVLEAIQKYCSQ